MKRAEEYLQVVVHPVGLKSGRPMCSRLVSLKIELGRGLVASIGLHLAWWPRVISGLAKGPPTVGQTVRDKLCAARSAVKNVRGIHTELGRDWWPLPLRAEFTLSVLLFRPWEEAGRMSTTGELRRG